MKKFVKIILGLGFWFCPMLLAGCAEGGEWGYAFLFLGLFCAICVVANFFYTERVEDEENTMYFKETVPVNFLENVMEILIECPNNITNFVEDELEVVKVYFAGKTLCIDVKDIDNDNDWKGTITITSNGTCGWFNPEGYSEDLKIIRNKLSDIEFDMYKEICKRNNINLD